MNTYLDKHMHAYDCSFCCVSRIQEAIPSGVTRVGQVPDEIPD
jgi:hypothetical protein